MCTINGMLFRAPPSMYRVGLKLIVKWIFN